MEIRGLTPIAMAVIAICSGSVLATEYNLSQSGELSTVEALINPDIQNQELEIAQHGPHQTIILDLSGAVKLDIQQLGANNNLLLESRRGSQQFELIQIGEHNAMDVIIDGNGDSSLTQFGTYNSLSYQSYGQSNSASLLQDGIANTIQLAQTGDGNSADLTQQGSGNLLIVEQNQGSLNVSVHQSGNNETITIK